MRFTFEVLMTVIHLFNKGDINFPFHFSNSSLSKLVYPICLLFQPSADSLSFIMQGLSVFLYALAIMLSIHSAPIEIKRSPQSRSTDKAEDSELSKETRRSHSPTFTTDQTFKYADKAGDSLEETDNGDNMDSTSEFKGNSELYHTDNINSTSIYGPDNYYSEMIALSLSIIAITFFLAGIGTIVVACYIRNDKPDMVEVIY